MRITLPLILAGAVFATGAVAVEGMWQPAQLPGIAPQLEQAGLEIKPEELSDLTAYPMGSIVSLGGCTASLVSDKGLIVTNHHCAYGALAYNSTPEENLIVDGFLAESPDEERPASPGMRVYVTESIDDVTDKVLAGVDESLSGAARYKAIEKARKSLVSECEEAPGYNCRVASFYGGLSYQLVRQLEIRDVRVVYAPPESIGKFGGDIDNWVWPRHTGDFSFLRAYVAPDGSPAGYAEENVPFQPRHVMQLNPKGLEAGDFVMVAGYPGRTNRYRLASEVEHALGWNYPNQIRLFEETLEIIADAAAENPDAGVKYASRKAGLNNYLKNFGGQIDGLTRADAVALKKQQEDELKSWLKQQDSEESRQQLADIERLEQLIADDQASSERDLAISQLYQSTQLSTAIRLVKLAKQRTLKDADRDSGYQERDWIRIEQGLKSMDRSYLPEVDARFLALALGRYTQLPADQRLSSVDDWLDGANDKGTIQARVDALYAGSQLHDTDERLRWFEANETAINDSSDTMLALARALQPQLEELNEEDKAFSGTMSSLRPRYMQAIIDWKNSRGEPVYPDANSTLRVTYGTVQGVSPKDAVTLAPFTTVAGILEKDTGEEPFDSPQAELEAIRAGGDFDGYASREQGALPVNFLADLDITGGNSGSPALDSKGRLVGLAFDGNWESVSGDWIYEQPINRAIQVDVRYMLWVMHHLDKADNLLREMGLEIPAAP